LGRLHWVTVPRESCFGLALGNDKKSHLGGSRIEDNTGTNYGSGRNIVTPVS
jgi:hypothetical protein